MWAVVVAGGSGSRFGAPKQFQLLAGRPVVAWSVAAARAATDGVVLVLPPGSEDGEGFGADTVVPGGSSRSESVRRGLAAVPEGTRIVVVHDAARPLASPALFRAVVDPLAAGAGGGAPDGVVCALAVADTVKRLAPDRETVVETVDRSELVTVQTPQAFRAPALREAHSAGGDATDDAALVEAIGGTVRVVPGEVHNVKVTVPSDLAVAEHLVRSGLVVLGAEAATPEGAR